LVAVAEEVGCQLRFWGDAACRGTDKSRRQSAVEAVLEATEQEQQIVLNGEGKIRLSMTDRRGG
jgi:hypothetical protein